MLAFLGPLLSFLGGPVISGLIGAYKAKLDAGNTAENIAADLAARELAVQQVEIQAQAQLRIAEIGHWYEPDKLFEYTLWIFFANALIWDNILGYGTYKPLAGDLLTWSAMIMAFLFGKRGIENVARIIKR